MIYQAYYGNWILNEGQCFKWIVTNPPRPLTEEDIWFQIGHVHEQQKDVGICTFNSQRLLTAYQ